MKNLCAAAEGKAAKGNGPKRSDTEKGRNKKNVYKGKERKVSEKPGKTSA